MDHAVKDSAVESMKKEHSIMLHAVSNQQSSSDVVEPKQISETRWLFFLCMLYITVLLLSTLLVHKMMPIGDYSISSGTFIFPFSYLLGDVIAEVYGYQFSRRLIWASLCCLFIFDIGSGLFAHTPAPAYWVYENDYLHVLGPLPRIFIGDLIGINAGAFANIYALTKWKVLTKGRFFWLRSLGATCIGEAVFVLCAMSIMFIGVIPFSDYLEIMVLAYVFKLLFAGVMAYPAQRVVEWIKRKEGIDVFDTETNFNPFRLSTQ